MSNEAPEPTNTSAFLTDTARSEALPVYAGSVTSTVLLSVLNWPWASTKLPTPTLADRTSACSLAVGKSRVSDELNPVGTTTGPGTPPSVTCDRSRKLPSDARPLKLTPMPFAARVKPGMPTIDASMWIPAASHATNIATAKLSRAPWSPAAPAVPGPAPMKAVPPLTPNVVIHTPDSDEPVGFASVLTTTVTWCGVPNE